MLIKWKFDHDGCFFDGGGREKIVLRSSVFKPAIRSGTYFANRTDSSLACVILFGPHSSLVRADTVMMKLRLRLSRSFPGGSVVKNLPVAQETQVRSLGQEDPLEKEMVTHSSILAWRIPWTEELGRLLSVGSKKVGYDWAPEYACKLSKIKGLGNNGGIPARGAWCTRLIEPMSLCDCVTGTFLGLCFRPPSPFASLCVPEGLKLCPILLTHQSAQLVAVAVMDHSVESRGRPASSWWIQSGMRLCGRILEHAGLGLAAAPHIHGLLIFSVGHDE